MVSTVAADGLELHSRDPAGPGCVTPGGGMIGPWSCPQPRGDSLAPTATCLRVPGSAGPQPAGPACEAPDVRGRSLHPSMFACHRPRFSSRCRVVFFADGLRRPQRRATALAGPIRPGGSRALTLGSAWVHGGSPRRWRRLLAAPAEAVWQGFLAAGHVCAVMGSRGAGSRSCNASACRGGRVTGFRAGDCWRGVFVLRAAAGAGESRWRTTYTRAQPAAGKRCGPA